MGFLFSLSLLKLPDRTSPTFFFFILAGPEFVIISFSFFSIGIMGMHYYI